jgi:two-component system response regulator MtrA
VNALMTASAATRRQAQAPAKVLVIEDDRDIRNLLSDALTEAGFDVSTVRDGSAGLAAARASRPDLVLLDWMMPGTSGLEVCRALRADYRMDAAPIVMLTARDREADVEWGYQAGADDYIVKPFSPRELRRRLIAVLARERATPRPRAI